MICKLDDLSHDKKLSDSERCSCEGKLTFEECGLAWINIKNETSPGFNGFTV